MASPSRSTVIIECPHCGTRYQVPAETIGAAGRDVACAHCGKTWQARAKAPEAPPEPPTPPAKPPLKDPDKLFDEAAERELDRAFEAEQAVATAEPGPSAPASSSDEPEMRSIADIKATLVSATAGAAPPKLAPLPAKKQPKRLDSIRQHSPLTRLRRAARVVAVGGLALLLVGGIAFRAEVVSLLPAMAGVYAAVGLGVNVVGLEFKDVSTLITRQSGVDRLQVDGKIVNVVGRDAPIPPIVVALLDASGSSLYEWSVTPTAASLQPGEITDFSTQLNTPPTGAARVRLTFSAGRAKAEIPVSAETPVISEAPAEADSATHTEAPAHDPAPAHAETSAHAESPGEHH